MDQVNTQIRNGDWSSAHRIKSATLVGISSFIGESEGTTAIQWGDVGNKFYLTDTTLDAVHQYSASTPYDITTLSPDFVTFSVINESTSPQGLSFSNDGLIMYVASNSGANHFNNGADCVIQYDLSTAWDINTAKYNNKFSNSAGYSDTRGLYVRPDQQRYYIIDRNSDLVAEYSMSPGNVSTASSTSSTFSVSADDADPRDLFFSPDGLNMYIAGIQNDDITHYTLSSAWNVSTAALATPSVYQIFGGSDPIGLTFKPDGTKMWQVSANRIYESSLTVPWSFSSVTSDTTNLKYSITYDRYDLHWKPDGTRVFFAVDGPENAATGVVSYDLGTPWDTSTLIGQTRKFYETSGNDTNPRGVTLSDDGTKLFVNGDQNNVLYRHPLSSAWDVTTAGAADQSYIYYNQLTNPRSCVIADGGTKFYTAGETTERISQFNLSTPYDLSTMKPSGEYITYDPDQQESTLTCVDISKDGKFVIVTGRNRSGVLLYELREPYRLSTASAPYTLGNQTSGPGVQTLDRGVVGNTAVYSYEFNDDGTRCWLNDSNALSIYEYALSDPWNIYSMYYSGIARDVSDYVGRNQYGFKWKPDGTKIYFTRQPQNQTNQEASIIQYDVKDPWDITTMTYETRYDFPNGTWSYNPDPWDIAFDETGTIMMVLHRGFDTVYKFTLSTAWDVSTAAFTSTQVNISSEEGDPRAMEWKPDGTQFLICGNQNERVYTYDVSTPWDLTTATLSTNLEYYTDRLRTDAWGGNDGQCLRYGDNGKILYYSTDDWDLFQVGLTSAYLPQSFRFAGIHTCKRDMRSLPEQDIYGLSFGKDGKKVYIHGAQQNAIFEYEI
jgi:6-phosphogluconolactonase (cycloisomerase 2 family)